MKKILKNTNLFTLIWLGFSLFYSGCNFAPKYQAPDSSIEALKLQDAKELKIKYQDYFKSKQLQDVIKIALENNKDIQIASTNIEIAIANYNLRRADLLPTISAFGSVTNQVAPTSFASFTPKAIYRSNLSLASFELDLFGKLRNLKKAAKEQYLSLTETKKVMQATIITQVANAYIQLIADKQIASIIQDALSYYGEVHSISVIKHQNGLITKVELIAIENLIVALQNSLEGYNKIINQDKTALMLLMGVFEETKIPNAKMSDFVFDESLIFNLSSNTLFFRPDIKAAEHNLIAANANIGAARAAFLPSFLINGANYGYLSRSSADLFNSGAAWTVIPAVNLPIFAGGRNFANLKTSKKTKEKLVLQYQQTIQQAFREILNDLNNLQSDKSIFKNNQDIVYQSTKGCNIVQEQLESGLAYRSSMLNCRIKLASDIQNLIIANRTYLAAVVSLYRTLGVADFDDIQKQEDAKKETTKPKSKFFGLFNKNK